jgi:hypothetical protein
VPRLVGPLAGWWRRSPKSRGPRHVPFEGAVSPLHGVARAAQLDHTLTENAATLAPFATFIDYRVKK